MRPSVIITVNECNSDITYDIEVPTDIVCSKVLEDIIKTISSYNGSRFDSIINRSLFSLRLQRYLRPEESFGTAGIWNGDIITIM